MKGAIEWFARNGVAANLMMVFIMMSGIIAVTTVREELMPEIELDRISIQVPYLGAAPEEVEEAVTIRIEEAIQGLDGIKQIQSTAAEGMGTVTVELELGADARKVVDEVKSSVDAITTFPVEAEKPIIRELTSRIQVADIAIFGDVDLFTLKATAERVRDELTAIPGITQVDIVSAPPYEISIEVSEVALRRHGLTFDQIADAVRRSSLDLPGGSVRTEGGEILLRTLGQAYRGEEYENLVVWTRADGSRLRVGDVATVVDGFAETDQFARFDRTPTMMVSVFRTGNQSALELAALFFEVFLFRLELPLQLGEGLLFFRIFFSLRRLLRELQLGLEPGELFVEVVLSLLLLGRGYRGDGRLQAVLWATARFRRRVDVVEEGEQRVEVLLRQRVVFVVVAGCAVNAHSHEGGSHRGDPVDDVLEEALLGQGGSTVDDQVETVES